MAHNGMNRAAELEREVAAQRSRVEQTIGEIQKRLTPGQLVDELLSYTKDGGGQFVSRLGKTVSENPLPATLLGVSLAWLMLGPRPLHGNGAGKTGEMHEPHYATATSGGLQRIANARDEAGEWYSEFTDDAGRTYRAKSDELGRRIGDFVDETGRSFAGFMDEAGTRVTDFRDEAGNLLDEASGWAATTWHDLTSAGSRSAHELTESAKQMGKDVQSNAARLGRDAVLMLEEQPLVMGALAFAAGAALGAVLPRTEQEDRMIGEASDQVRREAGAMASDLYEQGKEKAAELYEDVSETAGEIYDDAKQRISGSQRDGSPTPARH
jgi:vacuolar-type H+-ATPase subunit H